MNPIPTIVPVSELRRDAAEIINSVNGSAEPVVITQRGRAKAVLQDIDEYQYMQRKLEIVELLARGEADIQAGRVIPADEVRREIHSFLDDLESKR